MAERRDFNDPKYKAWRKRVYARDRFRCRMPGCAGTDRRLNAHHIKCWSSHPSLRFAVSNGIALCRTCHERVKGVEQDFEATFSRLADRGCGDVKIQLMMRRHGPQEEHRERPD